MALAHGLAARELALIHTQAVVALAPSHLAGGRSEAALKRTERFFATVLVPFGADVVGRKTKLRRTETSDPAVGSKQLSREIARRKASELIVRSGRALYRQLQADSQAMEFRLHGFVQHLMAEQEKERHALSRALSDGIVPTLVGLNAELAVLSRDERFNVPALKAKAIHVQKLLGNSIGAAHRLARTLRPAVLDDLGLIPALLTYSRKLAAGKNLKIELSAFSGIEALGSAQRMVLYRVAQEALKNVARHAQASFATIHITRVSNLARMEICDNGRSFSVGKTLARNSKHHGLESMRERMEMVGGKLIIDAVPGKGTTVCAMLPLEPSIAKPDAFF
jgi:signal transduction histidine kinase